MPAAETLTTISGDSIPPASIGSVRLKCYQSLPTPPRSHLPPNSSRDGLRDSMAVCASGLLSLAKGNVHG
jgi:hypothetical protein